MLMRMEGMTTDKRILVNHVSHVDVKTKVNNFGLYTVLLIVSAFPTRT